MAKKVLVLGYGGGHMKMLLPIIEELNKNNLEVSVFALTGACLNCKEADIPYKSYKDYLHLLGDDKEQALKMGEALAEEMHNPESGMPLEESIAYLGVNLHEVHKAYGKEKAGELFDKIGRHIFLPVEFITSLLKEINPSLLVTTNSPKSERSSLIAADRLGIPSIRLEDLFIDVNLNDDLFIKLGSKEEYYKTVGRINVKPTKVCVMCDYSKELYETRSKILGIDTPLDDVIVTGQTIFESVDQEMQKKKHFSLISGREKALTLTWAHQNTSPDGKEVADIIESWFFKEGQPFNLVIKLHPNTPPHEVQEIEKQFVKGRSINNLRIILNELDPNEILWNSDMVISQESTMMTQAAYMNIPVLVMDPTDIRGDSPYPIKNAGRFVRNIEELSLAMKGLQRQSPSSFGKANHAFGFKSNGTKNICEVISDLLEEKA